VVFIYTVSGFARDGRANGGQEASGIGWFSERGFRNVGQYKPDAGDSPKRLHT
jgi:hypothetical protein